MREDADDVMRVLASGIAADETSAAELAQIASLADGAGEADIGRTLRRIVRGHRVRALALAGQLAAVSAVYGGAAHQGLQGQQGDGRPVSWPLPARLRNYQRWYTDVTLGWFAVRLASDESGQSRHDRPVVSFNDARQLINHLQTR